MRSFRRVLRAVRKDYMAFRDTWTGTVLLLAICVSLAGWRDALVAFMWASVSFAWGFCRGFLASFWKRVRS